MAAPKTNGVLRTKLADMKVGDYIKWYYRNFTTGVVGEFSQTPLADGSDEIELPSDVLKVVDDKSKLGDGKKGGYFYFIKCDNGTVVADRAIQSGVSAQSMNTKNCFKGSNLRLLTNKELQNLSTDTLNGNVTPKEVFTFITDDIYHAPSLVTQELSLPGRTDFLTSPGFASISGYTLYPSNNMKYGFPIVLVPVMEYVDNSRSTNIYY